MFKFFFASEEGFVEWHGLSYTMDESFHRWL